MQGVRRVAIQVLPVELADGRIGVRVALQSDGGVQGGARVAVDPVGASAAPGAVHPLALLPRVSRPRGGGVRRALTQAALRA